MTQRHLNTRLIHAGRQPRYTLGAINPVIQRTSSIDFATIADKNHAAAHVADKTLYYGRRGTLTHFALQEALTELEQGAGCYLFPCGAAAIANTILAFVQSGDHILVTEGAYEPTQHFCRQLLSKFQVQTDYFATDIGENIATLIQPNTKLVFLESPSSITMEIQDIPAIIAAVRRKNPQIVIVMDNTWAAGILFKPLVHGADVALQSGTKYLTGHSDVMLGTAVANARCWPQLREQAYLLGQMCDADSAYMASRGLRTLNLRLQQHQQNSLQVAQWLTEQPQVAQVLHPALPSSPDYPLWQRDFSGSCGLFSFVLRQQLSAAQLAAFCDHLDYFTLAYSWGGFESLIMPMQPQALVAIRPVSGAKINGTLLRIHVGLEEPVDLIADLAAAFKRVSSS